jgi:DNA repair exonuclease SbcCD ATPase subunit
MMLVPTRILAENFQCYPVLDLELKDRGLVLVTGENRRTRAANGNGAGKSAIFRAIRWCLYGELDEGSADDVVRRGERSVVVEVEAVDDRDGEWLFRRARKSGRPSFEVFAPGSDTAMAGDKAEIEALVTKLFGFDARTFTTTVYFGQNDTKRFASPAVKDTERKLILHRVLGTEKLRDAEKICRARASAAETKVRDADEVVRRCRAQIDEHDVEGLRGRRDEWEARRAERRDAAMTEAREALAEVKRLRTLSGEVSAIEADLAEVDEAIQVAEDAAARVVEIDEELIDARKKARQASSAADKAAAKVDRLGERLGELRDAETCPTCLSPVVKGSAAWDTLADLEGENTAARVELTKAQGALAAADEVVAELEADRRKNQAASAGAPKARKKRDGFVEELAEARAAAEGEALATEAAKKASARARSIMEEANPHTADLAAAEERVAALEDELEGAEAKAVTARRDLAHVSFWVTGFGQKGLPSYLLDRAMPELTERTNYYLSILSDGDITVEFSTVAEKKKGGTVDEIVMITDVEGFANVPPSGGQAKKLELAADLALMDLAARGHPRVPLLLLDECFDGLDDVSTQRVLMLLHELRSRLRSIFVITHDDGLGEEFEHVVRAVRDEDGNTSVEVVS